MATPTLDPQAAELIKFLGRGGKAGYFWGVMGKAKTSRWFPTNQPAQPFNSQHQNYFGVNPCTAIPETNSKGKQVKPEFVRSQLAYIAAINCFFGEFDAKSLIPVNDEDAERERQAHLADGKELTLDDARGYVQERIFLADPEPYKARMLQHIKGLDPRPSAVTDSGGGYHAWWFFDEPYILDTDEKRERAKYGQQAWVQRVRSDDDAKDLTRVLRIPGTKNFKPGYGPNFPTVTFLWCDFDCLYSFDDLSSLLRPYQSKTKAAPRTRTKSTENIAHDSDTRNQLDFANVAEAATSLGRISSHRRDKYGAWVDIGMALRELGNIGYCMWEEWSKASPKYRAGDCAEKWQTFRPGDEGDGLITLASLHRWAREDDPEGHGHTSGDSVPREDYDRVKAERDELQKQVEWEQKLLTRPDLKPTEKAVAISMYPVISANRHLGGNNNRIPISYDYIADVMKTSKSTVGRAVEMVEKVGLWRRDPEVVQASDGYDLKHMRLELQPTYDTPEQAPAIERTQQGGKREGAGRRPKCEAHPEAQVIKEVTTITKYSCNSCKKIIGEPEIVETSHVLAAEIQDETEDVPLSIPFQVESGKIDVVPNVSELQSAHPPRVPQPVIDQYIDKWSPRDDLPVRTGTQRERLEAAMAAAKAVAP